MAWKFVVDEDLPEATAAMLKRMGYWAKHIRQISLRGASDQEVFQYAQNQNAVLITADKGFGDVRRFPIGSHYGIIILRLRKRDRNNILQRLQQVVLELQMHEEGLIGKVVIASDTKVRIRFR